MSASEILESLDQLSLQERRELSKRLFELEEDGEGLQFSLVAAEASFLLLDETESEDGEG